MKCNYSHEDLIKYAGHNLSVEGTDKIKEHLRVCKTCKSFYEALILMEGFASSKVELRPDFHNNIVNALDKTRYSKKTPLFIVKQSFNRVLPIFKPVITGLMLCTLAIVIGFGANKFINYFAGDKTNVAVDPSPTIEDIEEIIDKNIETIVSHPNDPLVGFSSNPYNYIESNREAYDEIVHLGEPALAYLIKKFEDGDETGSGLDEYIMASACCDILDNIDPQGNPVKQWQTGRDWYEKYMNSTSTTGKTKDYNIETIENIKNEYAELQE